MKNIFIVIVSLALIGFIGFYFMEQLIVNDIPNNSATTTPTQLVLTITQVTENQITLSNGKTISIDQFADEIKVAPDGVFGSSDRIKNAQLSPDQKHISIAVGGAAHDFGWIYEIATGDLFPVIFSYGGGVEVGMWKSTTKAAFIVTSPEPKTTEQIIDLQNLAPYPSL